MKAFLMGVGAMVVITIAAAAGLGALDMSAGSVYSSTSGNVRL